MILVIGYPVIFIGAEFISGGGVKLRKIFFFVIIVLIISSQNIIAQSKSSISYGAGYIGSSLMFNNAYLPYWDKGFSLNILMNYNYSDRISFFLNTSYKKFYYSGKGIELIVLDNATEYHTSENVDNSYSYEALLGCRLYSSGSGVVRSYFTAAAGAVYKRQGDVIVDGWNFNEQGGTYYYTNLLTRKNVHYFLPSFNAGFGFELNIIESLQLDIEGNLSISSGLMYVPVSTYIKFDL